MSFIVSVVHSLLLLLFYLFNKDVFVITRQIEKSEYFIKFLFWYNIRYESECDVQSAIQCSVIGEVV